MVEVVGVNARLLILHVEAVHFQLMEGRGYGLIGNLIVGVIGAMIGGHVAVMLQIKNYGLAGDIVTATLGSILLLALLRFATRGR